MPFRGTITFKKSPGVHAKLFRKVVKKNLKTVGLDWHKDVLPQHRKEGAEQKYGMRRRSEKYTSKKRELHGHSRPLEKTGRMMELLESGARVTSTSRGGKVIMRGPTYTKFHNKPREITAIRKEEIEHSARRMHHDMTRDLNKLKDVKIIRV